MVNLTRRLWAREGPGEDCFSNQEFDVTKQESRLGERLSAEEMLSLNPRMKLC